jgi:outer membrane protein assembly factor BamD (BamD/ComL family)
MLFAAVVITGGVAARVLACGDWGLYDDHSVRFSGYLSERRFGRLPSLPDSILADENKLFTWKTDGYYDDWNTEGSDLERLWTAAGQAQERTDLHQLREHLRRFLEASRGLRDGNGSAPENLQLLRNSAIDKLDALTALDQGSPAKTVLQYLRARDCFSHLMRPDEIGLKEWRHNPLSVTADYDHETLRRHLVDGIEACRRDRNLCDNAAYLDSARKYYYESFGGQVFDEVARRFPGSEKREAAMFMSAVASMKDSESFGRTEVTDAPVHDEAWETARRQFKKVMREYPKGRYHGDAWGWLAFLWLRVRDLPNALTEYYRMLASRNAEARAEAVFSLNLKRRGASDIDMSKVERLIENEPAAALAYAYYEIYNYVVWHRCEPGGNDYWDNDSDKVRGLERIAAFATRMMARYPRHAIGAGFVLRVAEANLELENNAEAARMARRALGMGIRNDERAEALWVAGAAEHRLQRFDSARSALSTLVKENPNNRYTEGGRRLLAMLLEDQGNLEGALDQYLALDYRHDVAYFVDVLMQTDRLARFVEDRPSIPNRDELIYALGIRYLRDRRWNDARQTLARIKPLAGDADDDFRYKRYNDYDETLVSPKLISIDPKIRGIRQAWIAVDLRTATALETLEREVESVHGDEAKAEALYKLASYQFEGNLQFYNAAAWRGLRHYLLGELNEIGGFRQPNESQLLFEYMQKHDQASNALPIYLEVVKRFPKTRAARDALYTAAVCHLRLNGYNSYWRGIYEDGGHAGPAMVTFADVRRTYPGYALPRGDYGWEPSTRTVNGGPGWEPPPKPQPRPSRWQRLKPYLDIVFYDLRRATQTTGQMVYVFMTRITVAIFEWCYHLGCALFAAFVLWFVWSNVTDTRRQLIEALYKCPSRPLSEANNESIIELNPSGFANRYLRLDVRDEWIAFGKDFLYKVKHLDQAGRSALVRTATGDFLATLLIFALLEHFFSL